MNHFYIWIAALISSYEPIVTKKLLQLGYTINPDGSNNSMTNNNTIIYRVSHTKSVVEVEEDIANILNCNSMKYHSIVVTNIPDGFIAASRASNIDYKKIVKTPSEEIELAMIRVNNIFATFGQNQKYS